MISTKYKPPTKEFICKNCSIVFVGEQRRKRTVCSLQCSAKYNLTNNVKFGFRIGHKKRLGIKHPNTFIQKRKTIGNPNWKGDKATISSIHCWIRDNFLKKYVCEFCKKECKTDWSNKDHLYKRIRSDWQELCRKCHMQYDTKKGIKKPCV